MAKKPTKRQGVFFYERQDGTPSDTSLHRDLLKHEDEITERLVKLGVIRQIIVVGKKPKP